MTAAALIAPLRQRGAYAGLAFLVTGLPLGVAWFAMLLALWIAALSVALSLLLSLPIVIAIGAAGRWAAQRERALANSLLGAGILAPGRRALRGRGLWARAKVVLGDPVGWREQVYLLMRFVVGLPFAVLAVSLVATALGLALAPLWYWAPGEALNLGIVEVDNLGEALASVPVGLVALVLVAHLVRVLAAAWRGMARGLLGGSTVGSEPSSDPARRSPRAVDPRTLRRRRMALQVHAGAGALVLLLLVVIWLATTPGGDFWPIWPILPLAMGLGIHAVVEWSLRRVHAHRGLAIHAGVASALALYHVAVWLVSGAGYFWPIWVIIGLAVALAIHVAVAYVRRGERIDELTTTRAGAVDAQAAELRRIERDLHDGAQARLVALAMDLGLAEEKLASEPEAARLLVGEARAEARRALVELRDLARGIHPPVLTDRGLAAAVSALAARSPVPVTVTAQVPERPAAAVESAAYFTVAEALTNAAKHSGASRIDVRLDRRGASLRVEVEDDGAGGADPAGGGLTGLRRRVEALDGRLEVDSPAGGGTRLRAELPCGS